jgi:hypothetical protein
MVQLDEYHVSDHYQLPAFTALSVTPFSTTFGIRINAFDAKSSSKQRFLLDTNLLGIHD